LQQWKEEGLLTRLDTAFSRDQENKIYVQDRMQENAAELFEWLESGASFDAALTSLIQTQGHRTADEAKEYVKHLKQAGRYCRDVY